MILLSLSLLIILIGGVSAFAPGVSRRFASNLHTALVVIGCGLGLVPACQALMGQSLPEIQLFWHVPAGQIAMAVDPLAGLFLLLLFVVSAAVVVFGSAYFEPYESSDAMKSVRFFLSLFI